MNPSVPQENKPHLKRQHSQFKTMLTQQAGAERTISLSSTSPMERQLSLNRAVMQRDIEVSLHDDIIVDTSIPPVISAKASSTRFPYIVYTLSFHIHEDTDKFQLSSKNRSPDYGTDFIKNFVSSLNAFAKSNNIDFSKWPEGEYILAPLQVDDSSERNLDLLYDELVIDYLPKEDDESEEDALFFLISWARKYASLDSRDENRVFYNKLRHFSGFNLVYQEPIGDAQLPDASKDVSLVHIHQHDENPCNALLHRLQLENPDLYVNLVADMLMQRAQRPTYNASEWGISAGVAVVEAIVLEGICLNLLLSFLYNVPLVGSIGLINDGVWIAIKDYGPWDQKLVAAVLKAIPQGFVEFADSAIVKYVIECKKKNEASSLSGAIKSMWNNRNSLLFCAFMASSGTLVDNLREIFWPWNSEGGKIGNLFAGLFSNIIKVSGCGWSIYQEGLSQRPEMSKSLMRYSMFSSQDVAQLKIQTQNMTQRQAVKNVEQFFRSQASDMLMLYPVSRIISSSTPLILLISSVIILRDYALTDEETVNFSFKFTDTATVGPIELMTFNIIAFMMINMYFSAVKYPAKVGQAIYDGMEWIGDMALWARDKILCRSAPLQAQNTTNEDNQELTLHQMSEDFYNRYLSKNDDIEQQAVAIVPM